VVNYGYNSKHSENATNTKMANPMMNVIIGLLLS